MNLVKALEIINHLKVPVFQSRDASIFLNVTSVYASKILSRLESSGHLIKLKRGLWGIPDRLDPLALPNYLLDPLPAYVSFHSALYYRNVIDQIPTIIYVATLHKTVKIDTPIATVSAHQIHPDFFFGYICDEKNGVKMATSEKALVDILYLSSGKSKIFNALPELNLEEIDLNKVKAIIKKIPAKYRQTLVLNRFNALSQGHR